MRTQKKVLIGCGSACVGAITILVIVYYLAILGVRKTIEMQHVTPLSAEEKVEMERFFEEPIVVPEEWRTIEPVPEEVRAAARELCRQSAGLGTDFLGEPAGELFSKLNRGQPLEDGEWAAVQGFVAGHEDSIQAVTRLVSMEGYEFGMFPSCDQNSHHPHYLLVGSAGKLFPMRAYYFAHQKDWDRAVQACKHLLWMVRRQPACFPEEHGFAITDMRWISRTICRIGRDCDEAEPLQSLLAEMNRLDPQLNLGVLDDLVFLNSVATLRALVREGEAVDLVSKKPRAYFWRQMIRLKEHSGEEPLPHYEHWKKYMRVPGLRRKVEEMYYRESPFFGDSWWRSMENVAQAEFDLARLALATRLMELETGKQSNSVADLSERYVTLQINDPFSGRAYQWDPQAQTFYSWGPDGVDQRNHVMYDVTNGTMSAGDVSCFHRSLSSRR